MAEQYADISNDFSANPITKDISTVTGAEAVKSSISNILKTNTYDRVMQPHLGSNLRQFLFEPISQITAHRMTKSIQITLASMEPRAQSYEVAVEPIPDNNEYRVQIKLFVIDQIEPSIFETYLTRNR